MKNMAMFVLLVVVHTSVLRAQVSDIQSQAVEDRAKIDVLLSQDKIRIGAECSAMLIVSIDEGWHINSSTPNVEGYTPTSVEMERRHGIELVEVKYPPAFEETLDFSDTPLEVYQGSVNIRLKFRIARDAKPGKYSVPLELRYQACSNEVCLAPNAVRVDIPFVLVDKKGKVSLINQELFDEKER